MKSGKFKHIGDKIQCWIEGISKEKWSLTHDQGGCRYDHMTTNLSNVVNQIFKDARNMPITALVMVAHDRPVNYFMRRGAQARVEYSTGRHYCKSLLDALQKHHAEACTFHIKRYDIG